MFPVSVLCAALYYCNLITVGLLSPGYGGPIFASAQPAQGSYVTQTVYGFLDFTTTIGNTCYDIFGFLDFTTTIGNTVMIFSPQSAAPVPVPKETATSISPVINTTPIINTVVQEVVIKPSTTSSKGQNNKGTKISNSPNSKNQSNKNLVQSSKVEIQPVVGTKINVIDAVNTIANAAPPSSKIQILPAPSPEKHSKKNSVVTKIEIIADPATKINPPIVSSHVEVREETKPSIVTSSPSIVTSIVEIQPDEEPALIVGNNIGEPEYDFLSRQPSEVVEETYKVVNLKPSSKFRLKPRPTAAGGAKSTKNNHPTGLVTKLGGTVVKDGITTVHETSVLGTYISGKYAQVLQSTSQVINGNKNKKQSKINPSGTLRILKTAAPSIGKSSKHNRHLEPTPSGSINDETALPVEALFNSQNSIKQGNGGNRKLNNANGSNGGSFKRFKNRQREQEIEDNEAQENDSPHFNGNAGNGKTRNGKHRASSTSARNEQTTTPQPSTGKRYNSRKNKHRTTTTSAPTTQEPTSYSRRGYKPKLQATPVESNPGSTSLYKFKLNRSPGRWQYKTTPKPRITIRKQGEDEQNEEKVTNSEASPADGGNNDVVTPQSRSDDSEGLVGSESVATIVDDDITSENKLDNAFPLETIKVEISTPPDFKDIYYEIATIKSPYTFQVGSVKNTRYITVTSTFEKVLDRTESTIAPTVTEPLTENILATTSNYAKDNNYLDSSIATLPHLYLASDMETPPLETLTETFSTSQTMLKTHILPVIRGPNETSSFTLVQTYLVSRLVTATKTLPPMEAYHFIPSKTLNEFNSHLDEAGSELHLELEFGDENDQDDERRSKKVFPKDLDLANIGSDLSDLSDVDKTRILESHLRSKKEQQAVATTSKPIVPEQQTPSLSPEQLQQLAFLRLLNPAAAAGLNPVGQGQVITTSKPVLRVETLYESLVIPVVNGGNTRLSTISKSLGTVTKTDYEYGTSVLPGLPIPQVNPIFPPQQPGAQFAVTSSPIVQNTVVTETESKILKLTFGAKTAYTTIFSTKVVPTVLTTYMTASVPVQPTAAFPGYFPAPYPPFPYVG
ncbi:putative sperm flagellar membrane protein [Popillia japonica]|uniref:Sperm flagellar membrane protein n=1 Tax=Popillia japonica TaxID=7064 RepID=A0AAW1NHD3_POPJA